MYPAAHRVHLRQLPEVRIAGLGFAGRVRGQVGARGTVYGGGVASSGEEPAETRTRAHHALLLLLLLLLLL